MPLAAEPNESNGSSEIDPQPTPNISPESLIPFDFRRTDRISRSQLQALQALHEIFTRNLGANLSGYLGADITAQVTNVQQLSFKEFREGLPSPRYVVSLGLRPFQGYGVLDIGPSLMFPILEIVMGGSGQSMPEAGREITEVELTLLDSLLKLILHDLRSVWKTVDDIEFSIAAVDTVPTSLRLLAPQEAVVVIGMEVRIGATAGDMNFAIPSAVVKALRQKLDLASRLEHKNPASGWEAKILQRLLPGRCALQATLSGARLSLRNLAFMEPGDVLSLHYPVAEPLNLVVNGVEKYQGRIVARQGQRAFVVDSLYERELHL
jgi:flagellar motor switch protein FliM